jgi:hypothetical protein
VKIADLSAIVNAMEIPSRKINELETKVRKKISEISAEV